MMWGHMELTSTTVGSCLKCTDAASNSFTAVSAGSTSFTASTPCHEASTSLFPKYFAQSMVTCCVPRAVRDISNIALYTLTSLLKQASTALWVMCYIYVANGRPNAYLVCSECPGGGFTSVILCVVIVTI